MALGMARRDRRKASQMTELTITLSGRHVTDAARERAQAEGEAFMARHGLTPAEVAAIFADADHPLFDELDSVISNAASADVTNFVSYVMPDVLVEAL
jgi:hypothetical protein